MVVIKLWIFVNGATLAASAAVMACYSQQDLLTHVCCFAYHFPAKCRIVKIFSHKIKHKKTFTYWTFLYLFWKDQPGPAAISGGWSSPSLLAGGGTPLCILASRRWGPTYIAGYVQCTEPWADFFEVVQLLIWWRGSKSFFLTKEASGAAFCSLLPSTLGLRHRPCPTAWHTAIAPGEGRSFIAAFCPGN